MTCARPMSSAEAIALVEAARGPDDLFGAGRGSCVPAAGAADPSRHLPRRQPRGATAFAKLAALWRQYQDGHGVLLARGDIANLYQARDGLLKLARDPADNDLMRAETIALAALRTAVDPPLQAYFPEPVRARRRRDPRLGSRAPGQRDRPAGRVPQPGRGAGRVPRRRRPARRGVDVAAPAGRGRARAPGRADPRRGAARARDDPPRRARPGAGRLVLFGPGARGPGPDRGQRYLDWYPPEVLAGYPAGPDLDIWLATRCMTALVGRACRPGWPPSPAAACWPARPAPGRRVAAAGRVRRTARPDVGPPHVPPLRHAGLGISERRPIMGSGRWSTDVYDAAERFRAATGASAFAYSDTGAARVHDRSTRSG